MTEEPAKPVPGERFIARLIAEFGYSPKGAIRAAADLDRLSSPVLGEFLKWWESGVVPEISISGYTVGRLTEERGMKLPAAFLALGWLSREPSEALAALDRGYDKVVLEPAPEKKQ